MPTAPSLEVTRKFAKRLQTAIGYHEELLLAVHLKTHQAALETMLAEQFVLNAAVMWEVFISDLLLAYMGMAPQPFIKGLRGRILQSVREKYGSEAAKRLSWSVPRRPASALVASLADPKSFNITVPCAADLAKRANALLAAQHAKRFTLGSEDAQVIDLTIAVRNYLGHRSDASRVRLREAVNSLTGVNASLAGPVGNVGAYLKVRVAGGDQRAVVIAKRLVAVATGLA